MARSRPGITPATELPINLRRVVEPLLDLVARITGAGTYIAPVKKIGNLTEKAPLSAVLGGGATLAQTITKVNELQALVTEMRENDRVMRAKIDEIIARLQED